MLGSIVANTEDGPQMRKRVGGVKAFRPENELHYSGMKAI